MRPGAPMVVTDVARGPIPPSSRAFLELHEHAEMLGDPGEYSDLAGWLAECLVILTPPPPARAIESCAATHDAVDERCRWLRLGARKLLGARTLGPCASEVVCAGAAGLLADTGLVARPHDFDTARAWEHQAIAHAALAPACGRALRGSHGAGRRARELLAERLRQTVAVLWLLNHRTTRPARGERPGSRVAELNRATEARGRYASASGVVATCSAMKAAACSASTSSA